MRQKVKSSCLLAGDVELVERARGDPAHRKQTVKHLKLVHKSHHECAVLDAVLGYGPSVFSGTTLEASEYLLRRHVVLVHAKEVLSNTIKLVALQLLLLP